jgi:outer membrane protein OmpA-like peptidoglycan-associated protein
MSKTNLLILIVGAFVFEGCAAVAPKELVDARAAYQRASTGPAAQVAPAELHVAKQALNKAEQSFAAEPDSYQVKDLAYVAHRKAQMAEVTASITTEQMSQVQASKDYRTTQGKIVTQNKQNLSQTQSALAASERSGQQMEQRLTAEQAARATADERAATALAALANLATVKEEPRGMVITLSGSVLFASNRTTLLPAARARLDQVTEVLLASAERRITIEGHTDSQGSENHNMILSQGRADAVREYIIQRGFQGDLIQSRGLGEGQPVADNAKADGRANNRRVEIIIAKEDSYTSAQK